MVRIQERLPIRLLNWVAENAPGFGSPAAEFDPERIEREARRRTGLGDFGRPWYRAGFTALCRAYANDTALTYFGRRLCRGILLHLLENRLRITQELHRYPEILEQLVPRPLFVLGLPRTGTTFLYNLLALDPAARPLLYWESMQPSPAPNPETRSADPRVGAARKQIRRLEFAVPDFREIHAIRPDGPEECLGLLMNSFFTPFFRGRAPEYRNWLRGLGFEDRVAAYADYRRQLQLLQWKVRGEHWVLKCPSHLMGLDGLLETFPDASIVHMHRDLSVCVGSLCSLSAAAESLCYHPIDPKAIGQRTLDNVHLLLDGVQRGRGRFPDARILDLDYDVLTQDPLRAVRQIYDFQGYAFTKPFETRLREYLAGPAGGYRSKHRYRLEEYGLTQMDVQQMAEKYATAFPLAAPGV